MEDRSTHKDQSTMMQTFWPSTNNEKNIHTYV